VQLIQTGGSADAYYSASGVCRGTSEGFLAAACFRPTTGDGTVCGTWGTTNGWRLLFTVNTPQNIVSVQLELGGITTTTLYSMQGAAGRLLHCVFGCMRIAGDLQTFLVVNGNVVASDLVAAASGFLPATEPFIVGDAIANNVFDNVLEFQGVGFSNIEQFAGDYYAALRAASASWAAVAQTEAMYAAISYAAQVGVASPVPWDSAWDSQSAVDSGVLLYSATGRPLASETWKPRAGAIPLILQAPGSGRLTSLHTTLWAQPIEYVLAAPAVTWRDTTPFVQASWRRNYGNQVSGGLISGIVDAIAPSVKYLPHAQYWSDAVSRERAPVANADNIGWDPVRHTALACNDTHYIALQSGTAPLSWNHCLNFNTYVADRFLQIIATEDPLPPDAYASLYFLTTTMEWNGTAGTLVFSGVPPVGATCVIGWTYDPANTTAKGYLNGVLIGNKTNMQPSQATNLAKESWGAGFPAIRGIDALQYERLFCAGVLTEPQMATVAANMLADYPP